MGKASILLLCVFIGCSSNKLDEKTAAEGIKSLIKGDVTRIYVEIGRVGTDCVEIFESGEELPINLDPGWSLPTHVAELAGYLTETLDGPGSWKVSLTDKGRAALAAGEIQLRPVPPRKGCDYQQATLILASSDFVKITDIIPGKDSTQVDYLHKWVLTDLGRSLRQDGKVYALLDFKERDWLKKLISGRHHKMPLPAPADDYTEKASIRVKKLPEGWRLVSTETPEPRSLH
jgi:hypothetical protein